MAAAESAQTAIDKYFEDNKMGVSDIENAELLVTNDAHFDVLRTIEFPRVEVINRIIEFCCRARNRSVFDRPKRMRERALLECT